MFDATRQQIAQQLQRFFAETHSGIVCVYLYGSMARGEARQASDIDLAVLYAAPPPATLEGLGLTLGDRLEQLLGRAVDLQIMRHIVEHRLDDLLAFTAASAARLRI